jgi:homoserine dehydrogenase
LAILAVRNRDRTDLPDGVDLGGPDEALDADIVVELAGGVDGPREWARTALDRGTPYVTANKALLATHGGELAELAERRVAALLGSASVGGGTPMIETTSHLAANGEIVRMRGIVNATTTFILSAMAEGRTYEDALAEAQAAGYGSTVRLVAEATPDERSVGPRVLDPADPLAVISGAESMLEITMRDGSSFRISGPGAGGHVTARAVYADVARLVAGERPILFAPR